MLEITTTKTIKVNDMSAMKRPFGSRLELLGMNLPRVFGFVPPQLNLENLKNEKRAYLMHNPKAAGSSLREAIGDSTGRTLHIWAKGAFRKKEWDSSFIVCAVREPLERFLSGYRYHVLSEYRGYLYKLHGEAFKTATIEEYFACIQQYPDYLGPQSPWYSYPSTAKPICDLLLKVEDSKNWMTRLNDVGISVRCGVMPAKNQSKKGAGAPTISTMLLQQLVDYYAEDYEKLNYSKPVMSAL